MPGSRAAGLGQDHQRFLQDHDERARARPADQAARDAAVMDPYPRSDLRVLVRLFPGHDGQSDDRVLQQPRDCPARDLPADFCRGYRGPKIACSIERPADRETPLCVGRDGGVLELIWVGGEAEYFSRRGWTAKRLICPSGKWQKKSRPRLLSIPLLSCGAQRLLVRQSFLQIRTEGDFGFGTFLLALRSSSRGRVALLPQPLAR